MTTAKHHTSKIGAKWTHNGQNWTKMKHHKTSHGALYDYNETSHEHNSTGMAKIGLIWIRRRAESATSHEPPDDYNETSHETSH